MMNRLFPLSFLLLLTCATTFSQRLNKADRTTVAHLRQHISYLADDKLEGRRAGTKGEKMAADYIIAQFRKSGLQPKGDNNNWLQAFDIYDGRQVNSSSHLIINGHDLRLNDDYFPFPFSANASTEAAVSLALAEPEVPWFLNLKDMLEENKENPHFDLTGAIIAKAKHASSKGATALILYNTSGEADKLKFESKDRNEVLKIPVLYITADARKKYLADEEGNYDIKLKTDIGAKQRKGNNVIGYINN